MTTSRHCCAMTTASEEFRSSPSFRTLARSITSSSSSSSSSSTARATEGGNVRESGHGGTSCCSSLRLLAAVAIASRARAGVWFVVFCAAGWCARGVVWCVGGARDALALLLTLTESSIYTHSTCLTWSSRSQCHKRRGSRRSGAAFFWCGVRSFPLSPCPFPPAQAGLFVIPSDSTPAGPGRSECSGDLRRLGRAAFGVGIPAAVRCGLRVTAS